MTGEKPKRPVCPKCGVAAGERLTWSIRVDPREEPSEGPASWMCQECGHSWRPEPEPL